MPVKQFNPNVAGPAVLFVKADWCGHCKTTKPEIRAASSLLGSSVPIYEVDSERDADTVKGLGVSGFPTIIFLNAQGRLGKYTGERTGQKIAQWAAARASR